MLQFPVNLGCAYTLKRQCLMPKMYAYYKIEFSLSIKRVFNTWNPTFINKRQVIFVALSTSVTFLHDSAYR